MLAVNIFTDGNLRPGFEKQNKYVFSINHAALLLFIFFTLHPCCFKATSLYFKFSAETCPLQGSLLFLSVLIANVCREAFKPEN